MDSREVVARFAMERQALATMDHPSISHVYDAGTTPAGRPYFVMEHVVGLPITTYCEQHAVPLAQRLDLFERVCLAVQHAHQKGLIHRDLKPSNILVTTIDGQPQPKIIDFGIAKAIGPEHADQTAITLASQFIGTPQYMSPEQAGLLAPDIDTRADVYALGVILYELLIGTTPIEPERFSGIGYAELVRIISEDEPPRPSARLREDPGQAAQVAARRQIDPARLQRILAEDLDWIVLRAMEKERDRRYPTASALAADLQRFLRNEPVEAGPPTVGYRFGKFARRHRAVLTAGGAVAAAILLGLVLAVIGLVEARAQQRRAAASLAESEAVTTFLSEVLSSADPRRLGRDATVVQMLDAATVEIDSAFTGRPWVEARVRETIGRTYLQLGRYEDAERHNRRAYALAKAHLQPTDRTRLLTTLSLGQTLTRMNRRSEAGVVLAEALDLAQVQEPVPGRETLRAKKLQSDLFKLEGNLAAAEPLAREVLESRLRLLGDEDPETLVAMTDLGTLLMEAGRIDEAEPMYRDALASRRRLFGDDHPDTIASIGQVAEVRLKRRDPEGAESLWREALALSERVNGPEHPQTLAIRSNLSTALAWLRRYEEAEALLSVNLEDHLRTLGPDHRQTLGVMHNLGAMNGYLGRRERELELKSAVLEARYRLFGWEHPDTIASEMTLARFHLSMETPDAARPLLEHVCDTYRRTLPIEDIRRIEANLLLTETYLALGLPDLARPLVAERQEGKRINAERADAALASIRQYAEDLLLCEPEDLRRPDAAMPWIHRLIEMTEAKELMPLVWLAMAHEAQGDRAEALKAAERALPLVEPGSTDETRLHEMLARLRG
jgi:non-specific serine/threonine protein kinase/serine/threonine-protein kinase